MSLFLKHEGADDEVENGGLLASLQSSGKPHERFVFAVKNFEMNVCFGGKAYFVKANIFMGGTHKTAVQQL